MIALTNGLQQQQVEVAKTFLLYSIQFIALTLVFTFARIAVDSPEFVQYMENIVQKYIWEDKRVEYQNMSAIRWQISKLPHDIILKQCQMNPDYDSSCAQLLTSKPRQKLFLSQITLGGLIVHLFSNWIGERPEEQVYKSAWLKPIDTRHLRLGYRTRDLSDIYSDGMENIKIPII